MNGNFAKSQIFQAWELAWQLRFCPPRAEITREEPGPEAAAHLKVCLLCRSHREGTPIDSPWQESAPDDWAGGVAPSTADPEPGQVWRLKPSLAGWGPKHRYYRPPVVLVLATSQHLANAVLVAQTHYDRVFVSEQDVMVDEQRFAQPWNVYTLHRDDLLGQYGPANPEAAEKVLEASQKPFAYLPPWSLSHIFRQMEVELGCYFSFAAAQKLMREYEAAGADQDLLAEQDETGAMETPEMDANLVREGVSPASLLKDLQDLGLQVDIPSSGEFNAADLYFQASPGEQQQLKAAATLDQDWRVPVLAFRIRRGRPVSCHFLQAHVTDFLSKPKVAVGGKILGSLPKEEKWQAEFRWLDEAGNLVGSMSGYLGPTDSDPIRFWAVFPLDEGEGQPAPYRRLYARLFSVQR